LRGLSYIGGLKAIKAGKTALLCAKIPPFRRVVAGLLQQRFSGLPDPGFKHWGWYWQK